MLADIDLGSGVDDVWPPAATFVPELPRVQQHTTGAKDRVGDRAQGWVQQATPAGPTPPRTEA